MVSEMSGSRHARLQELLTSADENYQAASAAGPIVHRDLDPYPLDPQARDQFLERSRIILGGLAEIDEAALPPLDNLSRARLEYMVSEDVARVTTSTARLRRVDDTDGTEPFALFTAARDYTATEAAKDDPLLLRMEGFRDWTAAAIQDMRDVLGTPEAQVRLIMSAVGMRLTSALSNQDAMIAFFAKPFEAVAGSSPAWRQRYQAAGRQVLAAYGDLVTFIKDNIYGFRDTLGMCHLPNGSEQYRVQANYFASYPQLDPGTLVEPMKDYARRLLQQVYALMYLQGTPGIAGAPERSVLNLEHDLTNRLTALGKLSSSIPTDSESLAEQLRRGAKRFAESPPVSTFALSYEDKHEAFLESLPLSPHNRPQNALSPSKYYLYNERVTNRQSVGLFSTYGHYLQIGRQLEASHIPPVLRRPLHNYAFREGWSAYSRGKLPLDLGISLSPEETVTILTMELEEVDRAILDIGVNYEGWDADKAREWRTEIGSRTNILHLLARPGYALAAPLGCAAFIKARKKAETELGYGNLDLPWFHGMLLENGSMPLHILASVVKRQIKAEAARVHSTE